MKNITEWIKPITKNDIKEIIIDQLKSLWENEYGNDFVLTEKLKSDVDVFANRIMYNFRNTLGYLYENYEEDFISMLNGNFK